jgi:hypothetical protein
MRAWQSIRVQQFTLIALMTGVDKGRSSQALSCSNILMYCNRELGTAVCYFKQRLSAIAGALSIALCACHSRYNHQLTSRRTTLTGTLLLPHCTTWKQQQQERQVLKHRSKLVWQT